MKNKIYDYRGLRLNNITGPRYRHLLLLLFWVWYFIMYFVTENLIPYEKCIEVHCRLDDLIPFCEYWAFFYCFWYVLIFGSLAWFLFFDVKSFTRLQLFIGFTQVIAMICYVFWPTIQNLRPQEFARDNIFTHIMGYIYSFDTPTGVCPSLHVGYTCGVVSAYLHKKDLSVWMKAASVLLLILISLSTAFVKQHSMVDVFFGLVTGLVAEAAVWISLRLCKSKHAA